MSLFPAAGDKYAAAQAPAGGPQTSGPTLPGSPPGGLNLTSHCLSLRTRLFSLDFTWGRLQIGSPLKAPAPFHRHPAPRRPDSAAEAALKQRTEIERRWQLAALLAPAGPGPAAKHALPPPSGSPLLPVCRAYALAAAASGPPKADGPSF